MHAELEALRAIGAGFRQPIDHARSLDTPAQALERKCGSGAVARQTLGPGSVITLDNDTHVEGRVHGCTRYESRDAHCRRLTRHQSAGFPPAPDAFYPLAPSGRPLDLPILR
jgi:hypothetical protein